MTFTTIKKATLCVSVFAVTACSNSYTHDYGYGVQSAQNTQNAYSQCATATYAHPSAHPSNACASAQYGQDQNGHIYHSYGDDGLRGPHSVSYSTPQSPHQNYQYQGTVLRGNAPYGAAANNAYYTNTHGYSRDKGGYFNLGAVSYDVDSNLYGVQARVGYNVSRYFGAEIEGSIGVNDETVGGTPVSVDHSAAAFALVQIPYTKRLSVLARGGYHTTQYGGAGSATTYTNGFAYGIGAEYSINRNNALRLDYTRYLSNAVSTNDAISLAYAHKF